MFASVRYYLLITLIVTSSAITAHAVTFIPTILNPLNFSDAQLSATAGQFQAGYAYGDPTDLSPHAFLWDGTADSAVDLNPTGFVTSYTTGVSATAQVGYGTRHGSGAHALLWRGTAASAIDLTPTGFDAAYALATSDSQQVGYGASPLTGSVNHALLWTGSADSIVDLNPLGYSESFANSVSNFKQVGYGYGTATGGSNQHALLWSGTPDSAVDLNPTGFTETFAKGIADTIQVGGGYGSSTGDAYHALLWSGTADSVVDLHPAGFTSSEAIAAAIDAQIAGDLIGNIQVGDGISSDDGNAHALAWYGTAGSAIDLHASLSTLAPLFASLTALGVSQNGSIVGFADDIFFHRYAILWTPQFDTFVPGDYNNDGAVDAADYVVWRNGGPLANEVATPGSNTPEDYTEWRKRFGNNTGGTGTTISTAIPEPSTLALPLLPLSLFCLSPSRPRRPSLAV